LAPPASPRGPARAADSDLALRVPTISWTRDVDTGIRRAFGKNTLFSARWHYMDTKAAADQADFIVTTNYRGLARSAEDSTLVPPAEVAAWTEANARPVVVGTYGFWVEDGGALAIATSPYEQGEVAARMALQIVEGVSPNTIPVRTTNQVIVFARGSALQRRGFVLPPIYEAFARATRNYFE
jgi:hypothetical protein